MSELGEHQNSLPVVRLVGVTEIDGESTACSLIFELEGAAGQSLTLTYGLVMEALRFAQVQGVMPALSEHWWARVEKYDGCTF